MSDFALGKKLPTTLFEGMPNEDLAAVNAYEVQDEISVVNNFRRKTIDGIESLKNTLADVNPLGDDFKKDMARLLATGDVDRIKAEGLSVLTNNVGRVISDAAPGLMDKVTSGVAFVKDKVLEALPLDFILDGTDGILTSVKNSDLVKGMSTLLDEVKDSKLVSGTMDLLSQSVMLGEMGALAVELGVPEFAEAWVDKAHDSVKDLVWARVGSSAIFNSDIPTLNKVLDNGGGAFLDRYVGNPANTLLNNFQYKVKDTINGTMSESFGSLKSTLDKIDIGWDTAKVGGVDRINLDVFKNISKDAKDVLSTDTTYRAIVNTSGLIYEKPHKAVIDETISAGTPKSDQYKKDVKLLQTTDWQGKPRVTKNPAAKAAEKPKTKPRLDKYELEEEEFAKTYGRITSDPEWGLTIKAKDPIELGKEGGVKLGW